jgi:hypothetical protein
MRFTLNPSDPTYNSICTTYLIDNEIFCDKSKLSYYISTAMNNGMGLISILNRGYGRSRP